MIELQNITKHYGKNAALNGISFKFEKGKIYGLLGPNGAGKSSTMNIMTGCLSATSGDVIIDGYEISSKPIKAKRLIGYLPETPPLYPEMTPAEFLHFAAGAKGLKKSECAAEIDRVINSTGISQIKDRIINNLSKGYKQRVGLAQALLGDPEYIILDEPMVGLDPNQIIEIRGLIQSLGSDHTVILSSHILSEVSNICDELVVILHGRIIAQGTMQDLSSKFESAKKLEIIFKCSNADTVNKILSDSQICPESITIDKTDSGLIHAEISRIHETAREDIFFASAAEKTPIIEMKMHTPSLEEIFIKITAPEIQDQNDKESDYDIDLQERA